MPPCPSCAAVNSSTSKFCSECGAALIPEMAATVTPETNADAAPGSAFSSVSAVTQHGRFLPGARIANRYRIVSLVGKGGMGEVYRADDLKLGHSVALKFLPQDVTDDSQRLEFFHNEVRLTRQISHPNVCRVYDIGEVDGQQFLSMEFIDGEDLRVLLRRIGRLPGDKGIELTQQLCAGLAAAHDQGVLHRDLKPANIMIDGRGQVRITDFGLARLASDNKTGEVAGTPAYMAPEQLIRGEATIQSDLYSLGLILHELFTGRAVHASKSLADRLRESSESTQSSPSYLIGGLDPAVERVILQCLEPEPHERPGSAHAIAAALPGGDPLAAALAAGETPSPELVAAAGKTGALSLSSGMVCLTVVVIAMVILPFFTLYGEGQPLSIQGQNPAKLIGDLQEDLLQPLGYFDPRNRPVQVVHGLEFAKSPSGLPRLNLWYRQSQDITLIPEIGQLIRGREAIDVTPHDPPPFDVGMASVRVDMEGRLIEVLAAPPTTEEATSDGVTGDNGLDDEALFILAGYEPHQFEVVDAEKGASRWKPPIFATSQTVYRNRSDDGKTGVIVARDDGRCVYFFAGSLDDPEARWFVPLGLRSPVEFEKYERSATVAILHVVLLSVALPLALLNLARGRVDRKGALRYAMLVGGGLLLVWLIGVHHTTNARREIRYLRDFLHPWTGYAFRIWVYYLALEPYVRRFWPRVLICWTRALGGRLRDPLLGRDVLLGCTVGTAYMAVSRVVSGIAIQRDDVSSTLSQDFDTVRVDPDSLIWLGASAVSCAVSAIGLGLVFLIILFLFRVLFRHPAAAFIAFMVLLTIGEFGSDMDPLLLALMVMGTGVMGLMVIRFGLVAGIVTIFCMTAIGNVPLVTDIAMWYGRATLVIVLLIWALATYGFVTSSLLPHLKHGGETLAKV